MFSNPFFSSVSQLLLESLKFRKQESIVRKAERTNSRIRNYFSIMNEPRNNSNVYYRASFSLQSRQRLVVFLFERQFIKSCFHGVQFTYFPHSSYPSPFSFFRKMPIVHDCLSLNTFHFACDNAQDNEMEKKYLFL